MKNRYLLQKDKHQKMINNFNMFFAFSNEQLEEGLKKLNTTKDNIISIDFGGFIKKEDKENYLNMLKVMNKESEKSLKDDIFLYEGFRYELANHEFCITYDFTDTLEVFGLEEDKLTEKQNNILFKARKDYLANCDNE